MSGAWTIHEASAVDADALALIGAATFLETFAGVLDGAAIVAHCGNAHSAALYRDMLAGGARAWLAGLAPGSAPVAFALLAPADLPAMQSGDLELKRIYALSRMHGTGLGAELMEIVLAAAQAARAPRLLLGVYAGNARARRFYERHGFRRIADRRFEVGGTPYDDIVLARHLG